MAFRVPNFNLTVRLWRVTSTVANPPDLTFSANLAAGEREDVAVFIVPNTLGPAVLSRLLCPKGTDIRGTMQAHALNVWQDLVEVPAGSGRYYAVLDVEDVGRGFPNEYRKAYVGKYDFKQHGVIGGNPWLAPAWPQPMP